MSLKLYEYSNGYNYDEFSAMCDRFKNLKLPGLKKYDVNRLLAEYIFGYSMQRFPVGRKNTLRRFLGGMFLYPMKLEGNGSTAFIFTGDGVGRPDYVDCIKKVQELCDDSRLVLIDRKNLRFQLGHILSFVPEFIWALKLNKINHNFNMSYDMAVGLYRAKKQGEYIYKQLVGINQIVTFCDLWSIESIITQLANQGGKATATLQHGNGTDILYGSCSNFYLANSKLSKQNCMHAGISEEKIVLTGPMKYAGEHFSFKNFDSIKNIGIVFDGAQNFENNIEMLQVIHKALEGMEKQCCIRFHPNNKRDDYKPYMLPNDIVYDDLKNFESDIDICIVYNSSMYTDMIYKNILVYRFKNGKVDLFPELNDRGFTNSEEFRQLLIQVEDNRTESICSQTRLYDSVFGQECNCDSYRNFFVNFDKGKTSIGTAVN